MVVKTHSITTHRFVRFLLVGFLNTIVGYSIFAVLILVGLHYKYAVLVGTICGVLFNFKTTGTLVFGNKNNMLIFRFVCVYIVTYFLSVGALGFVDTLDINIEHRIKILVAGAILTLPIAAISYSLNKLFVFRE